MSKYLLLAATFLALTPLAAHADDYSYGNDREVTTTTTSSSTYRNSESTSERRWMGWTGPYVSAFGGWNHNDDDDGFDTDGGWIAGGAVGGKMPWARTEIEGAYRSNDLEGTGAGQLDSTAIMANAYWDIENSSMITPYLGAGIGAAYVDVDATGGDDSWEFAYQGMAGARVIMNTQWTVGAEYRYFGTTDVGDTEYQNHAVLGTVGYQF